MLFYRSALVKLVGHLSGFYAFVSPSTGTPGPTVPPLRRHSPESEASDLDQPADDYRLDANQHAVMSALVGYTQIMSTRPSQGWPGILKVFWTMVFLSERFYYTY